MEKKLSAIKRIEIRAKQIPGAISLAQGIPSFVSHPLIQQGVINAIKENKVDKYSPIAGLKELRGLICEKLARKNMEYSPENEIIVTAGGIEALSATMLALLRPGDEVIILTPAYPYYERIIRMSKGKPVIVPLSEKNGWGLDLEVLKRKITKKTRAIIICNPNNPTGTVLSQKELLTIGILAQRHKFLIISDDIYENFYYDNNSFFNLYGLKQFKKQIIRIVSFSKDYALSGWRIGFMHGDKEIISEILVMHDNLVNCAPVVSQYAAISALKNELKILTDYREEYAKRRELMGGYLEKMDKYISFVYPTGSYYFFPRIIGVNNTERFCFDMLEKEGVATVPGEDFGEGGKGHIRLCFGKSNEEIEEGMKRIGNYLLSSK